MGSICSVVGKPIIVRLPPRPVTDQDELLRAGPMFPAIAGEPVIVRLPPRSATNKDEIMENLTEKVSKMATNNHITTSGTRQSKEPIEQSSAE